MTTFEQQFIVPWKNTFDQKVVTPVDHEVNWIFSGIALQINGIFKELHTQLKVVRHSSLAVNVSRGPITG